MRETSRGEEEEELRKILQSVLVRSLDAVEDLAVLAVHVRVLHTILLPRLPSRECHHVNIISCLIFTIPTLTPFHMTMKIAPMPAEITYPYSAGKDIATILMIFKDSVVLLVVLPNFINSTKFR